MSKTMSQSRAIWSASLIVAVTGMAASICCYGGAGIATDGSVGALQTISKANAGAGTYTIPQALGSLSGNNLFHSFSVLNIDSGQTATFTTTSRSIANVISRVTGGSASQINGVLRLTPATGSAPAFFLINPAGVVFGAGASISMPGAFHVSTADYATFANGDKFHADLTKSSTLSSAAPEAFGFVGATRAMVAIKDGARLVTRTLQPVDIVAGDIDISNGSVYSSDGGGDVRVVALGQKEQEIGLAGKPPAADGKLAVLNGGKVWSSSLDGTKSPEITIRAGSVVLDGQGSTAETGIFSFTTTPGNAGNLDVAATGNITITNSAHIASNTYISSGNAGSIKISAGSIDISGNNSQLTGIYTHSNLGSGNSSNIEVSVMGNLSIASGGYISSDTYSYFASAGSVKVNAGSIIIDRQGSSYSTGILSDTLFGSGNAGSVEVSSLGSLVLTNGGIVSSSTFSNGNAGTVTVSGGSITIDGRGKSYESETGIVSDANPYSSGNAGSIAVTAAKGLSITDGGRISSRTWSSGNAGAIHVRAGDLAVDGGSIQRATGIFSDGKYGAGNAGSIDVAATGQVSLTNGAQISSSTWAAGHAGVVKVSAAGIAIDGAASDLDLTGIFSVSNTKSTGNAGNIDVLATDTLVVLGGGAIASDTSSSGNAGTVRISAGSIAIDEKGSGRATGIFSQADAGTGNAGNVDVMARGELALNNAGSISSNTFAAGAAGSVLVRADKLRVDGAANGYSSKISAAAAEGSSGQTGSVGVAANSIILSNGGQISIGNNATADQPGSLIPTWLDVTAPTIVLRNSPNGITTKSSGNIAAGNIRIMASEMLHLDPGGITTTSNQGNGGAIDIRAGTLWLDNSQVATSVTGLAGNGGDIRVAVNSLVMGTGFIQANTAAANASGGLVSIAAQNLVPSGNTLFIGGNTPHTFQAGSFGYNVIQAAAPTGVSGVVQISSPTLDVAASLVGLDTRMMRNDQIARHPCETTGGSSLSSAGRGGLPLTGSDFLSPSHIAGLGVATILPAVGNNASASRARCKDSFLPAR